MQLLQAAPALGPQQLRQCSSCCRAQQAPAQHQHPQRWAAGLSQRHNKRSPCLVSDAAAASTAACLVVCVGACCSQCVAGQVQLLQAAAAWWYGRCQQGQAAGSKAFLQPADAAHSHGTSALCWCWQGAPGQLPAAAASDVSCQTQAHHQLATAAETPSPECLQLAGTTHDALSHPLPGQLTHKHCLQAQHLEAAHTAAVAAPCVMGPPHVCERACCM